MSFTPFDFEELTDRMSTTGTEVVNVKTGAVS